MMADRTPHKPPAEPAGRAPSYAVVLTALVGLALFAGALSLVLTPGPVMIVVGLFALAALHYLLWGWWMGRYLRQRNAEEDQRRRSADAD